MRRLGSLLALAGLLIVPPVALIGLGFYEWGRLNIWAPADYRLLLAVLTVAGWAAWLVFVVSVALEAIRIATSGRVALRLPGLAVPQAFAGMLLAGILATSAGPATLAVAAPLLPPGPTGVVAATTISDAAAQPVAPAATPATELAQVTPRAQAADAATVVHVVEQRDDLWSLAEKYYGSGGEWRRIVAANADLLGADPTADLEVGTALAIVNPLESYTIQRGDTLWHLAEERLGDGHRFTELQHLNADQISDPDYIETGWTIQLPAAPAPAPAAPAAPERAPGPPGPILDSSTPDAPAASPTPAPATPATAPVPPAAPGAQADSPDALDSVALRVALGGLAALAASGVVGGLIARRRERAADRELGRTFAGPDVELQRLETALGLTAEPTREQLIAQAQRLLAEHWWTTGVPALPLRRALVTPAALYFEFTSAIEPPLPAGFEPTQSPLAVRVTWPTLSATPPARHPVAYPALVTLGRDNADSLVLIDLVSWGVLPLEGDHEVPTMSLSAMLVELACAPWASELTLLAATADRRFVENAAADRVRCFAAAEDAVAELERHAAARQAMLAAEDAEVERLRLDPDRADAWAPVVALFELPLDAGQLRRVRAALERGPGLAAVLAGTEEPDAAKDRPRVRLSVAGPGAAPTAVLEPIGISVAAQTLAPGTREAIGALYAGAGAADTLPAPWWGTGPAEPDVAHDTIRADSLPRAVPGPVPGHDTIRADSLPRPEAPAHEVVHDTIRTGSLPRAEVVAEDVGHETIRTSDLPSPDTLAPADWTVPGSETMRLADGTRWASTLAPGDASLAEALAALSAPSPEPAPGEPSGWAGPAGVAEPATDANEPDATELAASTEPDATSAPGAAVRPADVSTIRSLRVVGGPRLRLFGRVGLEGAAGTAPAKAQRRCLEYCAWLLEHPGATASEMTQALFVTDGTRRSNLSRLRAWLGSTADGHPYLPEAYSGRIELHAGVTSDWIELQRLVDRGINQASPERLRAALALVDGAPLADAAPGEWAWAATLRARMSEAVRDLVVVLARAERERGDLGAARDALIRGQFVCPEDELIGRERLLVEAAAGDLDTAAGVLRALERAAAQRGDDLAPETVALGQELLEGRARPLFRSTGSEG